MASLTAMNVKTHSGQQLKMTTAVRSRSNLIGGSSVLRLVGIVCIHYHVIASQVTTNDQSLGAEVGLSPRGHSCYWICR